jgi:hypothetical protein
MPEGPAGVEPFTDSPDAILADMAKKAIALISKK